MKDKQHLCKRDELVEDGDAVRLQADGPSHCLHLDTGDAVVLQLKVRAQGQHLPAFSQCSQAARQHHAQEGGGVQDGLVGRVNP